MNPSAVILEITESVLMQQTDAVLARLKELKAIGVRLAIDDFGTGYSSLSYLQRFPFDKVKIDRSFVASIGSATDSTPVLRAMKAGSRGPVPARVEKLTLRLSDLGHELWEATQEEPAG